MAKRKQPLCGVFASKPFISGVNRLLASMNSHHLTRESLAKISAPTLVVTCDEDHVSPTNRQRELAEQISGAQLVQMQNCGHCAMIEKPFLWAALLFGFVNTKQTDYNY
jgi:pimeloyl-ACP methyl ester carboxylesterase